MLKKVGNIIEIEVTSNSMNNNTRKGFTVGDWVYCSLLQDKKVQLNKVYAFVHQQRGIIFRNVKKKNSDYITLSPLNPNFCDLKISLNECTAIYEIAKVLRKT